MQHFNSERKFGIEIEFIGDRGQLETAMRHQGLNCRVEGYNHHTQSHWKIVSDQSVQGGGWELVSPPLSGLNGMMQLKKATDALAAAECKINKTCGLHIHHDASDFKAQNFKNLLTLYARFEETVDSMMPKSRRGNNNRYCKSVKSLLSLSNYVGRLNQLVDIVEIINFVGGRYVKLNFKSFMSHGTVEFRQHSGSVEFTKIWNWVRLTQGFVERSIEAKKIPLPKNQNDNMTSLIRNLFCREGDGTRNDYVKEIAKYYGKRIKKLAA